MDRWLELGGDELGRLDLVGAHVAVDGIARGLDVGAAAVEVGWM